MNRPAGRGSTKAGWIIAWALLAASVAFAGFRNRNLSTDELFGATLGMAVVGPLVVLAIRFAYLRFLDRSARLWSPWVPGAGAVLTILFVIPGQIQQERDERAETIQAGLTQCREAGADPFPPLGRRLDYYPIEEDQKVAFAMLPPEIRPGVDGRNVARGREWVGFVLTASVGHDSGEGAGFISGVERGLQEQGATLDSTMRLRQGRELRFAELADGSFFGAVRRNCHAHGVGALTRADLRLIGIGLTSSP